MNHCAIEADSISKMYGSGRGVNRLTLQIPEGAVAAILGPNGSGKSTLFRMVCGMVKPTEGSLRVLGEAPGWQLNHSIAYLPDRARWFRGHTVAQALEWAKRMLPGFQPERAADLVQFMKLEPDMLVDGMSKGQEARLMLTVCMSRDVPLLVLDEPFSGIDMISREQIVSALIETISERKQTMLISTHEIAEMESLFDFAAFIGDGRTELAGDAEQLRAERGSLQSVYRQLFA